MGRFTRAVIERLTAAASPELREEVRFSDLAQHVAASFKGQDAREVRADAQGDPLIAHLPLRQTRQAAPLAKIAPYSRASTYGGLPDHRVKVLAVGLDGALWVGTGGGLARLDRDGYGQWRTYSKARGGLPDDIITALAVGRDGALWVGTYGRGLARLDKDGRWQTYSGLPPGHVTALAVGRDGALWVGTGVGASSASRSARPAAHCGR
jgi:ligand-binding sensor domain-containing protein